MRAKTRLATATTTSKKSRLDRCRPLARLLAPWAVCLLLWLAGLGALLVLAPGQAVAQPLPPAQPVYTARLLRPNDFPTTTLRFRCDSAGPYFVLENGAVVTRSLALTQPVALPSRVAIVLDVYRVPERDPRNLPPEVQKALGDAGRALAAVPPSRFNPRQHQIGVFVPANSKTEVVSLLTPSWGSQSLQQMAAALVQEAKPLVDIQSRAITNTGPLRLLVNMINSSEFTGNPVEHQTILLFSDGWDRVSQLDVDAVVDLANRNNIKIDTVYLPPLPQPVTSLERLANGTLGAYITNTEDISGVVAAVSRGLAWGQECTIRYATQRVPPTRVDIQAGDGTLVATALLPSRGQLAAPLLSMAEPAAGSVFTSASHLGFTHTVPVSVTWQTNGQPWERPADLAVLVTSITDPSRSHVFAGLLPFAVGNGLERQLLLEGFSPGSYKIAVVLTNSVGLAGTVDRPVDLVAAPVPPPTPTPDPGIVQRAWTGLQDQTRWGWADGWVRWPLLVGEVLLAVSLLWLILQQWRSWRGSKRKPTIIFPKTREAPAEVFALLTRENRSEKGPATRHMVELYADSQSIKLPEFFLEAEQRRFTSEDVATYCRLYSAQIDCGRNSAVISRLAPGTPDDASRAVDNEPVTIRPANATLAFELIMGQRHTLQPGDIVQFGDLHYRFILPREPTSHAGANGQATGTGNTGTGNTGISSAPSAGGVQAPNAP